MGTKRSDKEMVKAVENEELFWIPWKGEGERQLTFNEAQWIIGEIIEERGSADPEECHRLLMEAKERLKKSLSFTSVLVKVKGGTFLMNSNKGFYDTNVRTVTLTYDYWIGKYPVTFHECDMAAKEGCPWIDDNEDGRGFRFVDEMAVEEAIAYCNWLNKREGLPHIDMDWVISSYKGGEIPDITKVNGYRLPTLAEYENVAQRGLFKSREFTYGAFSVPYETGLLSTEEVYAEWCLDHYGVDRATVNPTGARGTADEPLHPYFDHLGFKPKYFQAGTTDIGCVWAGLRIARTVIP